MDKIQIQNKINELERNITKYNNEIQQYRNMNTKVNQAIPKLEEAKKSMNNANAAFKKYYSSDAASKKKSEFESVITEINNMLTLLKGTILVKSNEQIGIINNRITSCKNEKRNLEKQLQSM